MTSNPRDQMELLQEAIQRLEESGEAGLREFLAQHPEHASELRARIQLLEDAGLVSGNNVTPAESFPDTLGPFRILKRLGGGGMGVVYLAEDSALKRKVALKLIRPEHLWFPNALTRFRREVQIIAQLEHPNIVQVFSAGEEKGLSYFTMERVAGVSLERVLHEWKGRSPDDLNDRVLHDLLEKLRGEEDDSGIPLFEPTGASWVEMCFRWMRDLAEALDHAHGKGVLHRDLKPSNVMLTWSGRVLLLDFGLASTTQASRITKSGTQLGSLPYMAPEQLRLDANAVDEKSDVYSLGVTLYELLSLKNPFWSEGQSEERTRLRVAQGEAPSLRSHYTTVSVDAETVCAKAMDLDPSRRYATAAAFARDLRNVLELRPIEGSRVGSAVRVRRYVRRHPTRVVACVLGFLLVVVTPSLFAVREHFASQLIAQEKATAQTEAEISAETMRFLNEDLLEAVSPNKVGKDASMRQVLDVAAKRIEGRFPDRPLVEASIRGSIGNTYRLLGLLEEAELHLTRAHELFENHAGPEHPKTLFEANRLGQLCRLQSKRDEAVKWFRKTINSQRLALGDEHENTLSTQNNLGLILAEMSQFEESRDILHHVFDMRMRILGEQHEHTLTTMNNLGLLYRRWNRLEEASRWTEREYEICRSLNGNDNPLSLVSETNVADLLSLRGLKEEALAHYQRVLEVTILQQGPSHPLTLTRRSNVGVLLCELGRLKEAEVNFKEVIDAGSALEDTHRTILLARALYANLLRLKHEFDEALDLLGPTLQACQENLEASDNTTVQTWSVYGLVFKDQGNLEEASSIFGELIETFDNGIRSSLMAQAHMLFSSCCRQLGRFEEAEESLTLAHAWMQENMPESEFAAQAIRDFISLYETAGREEDAEKWRARLRATDESKR